MPSLLSWLDDRTGYKGFLHAALYEHVPGGARWRYVWGSTLVFAFSVQMVTGLFLWMHYSPSATTAWESVYYIQHEMFGGWLLRGIHHYTAQVMVVLLALHMLQVIVDGAYRAPREVNFWLGLVLLLITLGLSLTGYLLPWDQKGYWSTSVATSIMGVVPWAGPYIQRLVVGGPAYGHHTLTRFFAVHAGLLPLFFMGFTALHVYLFRRHGLRYKEPRRGADTSFWPDQVLRDAVACLGVLVVVLLLCLKFGLAPGGLGDSGNLGADLAAPADPSEPYGAARPEWYFLFLFQFLKLSYFAGHGEVYGAVVIPSVVMGLLFLMPLVGRWKVGHWFNVFLTVFLLTGIVVLTTMALVEDVGRPHLGIPLLGRLGLNFSIVWIGLLLLGVLVLIPTIGREREFRHNMYVLGALALGVLVAVAVVVAGGGTNHEAVPGPTAAAAGAGAGVASVGPKGTAGAATVAQIADAADEPIITASSPPAVTGRPFHELSRPEQVHRVLLFALLVALVLVITLVLLKSPVRITGRLAAGRAVTSAADAEAADAAALNSGIDGPPVEAPQDPAGLSLADHTSWVWRWEVHHRFRLALLLVVLGGTVLLTAVSVVGGRPKQEYLASVRQARQDAERVVALAERAGGIPPQGAVWLLRNDPVTQGPRLFARNCATCHRYDGHDGTGGPVADPQSAPDLHRFASRDWIRGMMDPNKVDSLKYFGRHMKAHAGKMVEFVKEDVKEATDEEDRKDLENIVLALAAEARRPDDRDDPRDAAAIEARIEAGRVAMKESAFECTNCHAFRGEQPSLGGANRGPDLTGYGSRQWLIDAVRNIEHPRFYPGDKNDRMPLYGEQKILDERSIAMIADWIRGDLDASPEPSAGAAGETSTTPGPKSAPATPPSTAPAKVPASAPEVVQDEKPAVPPPAEAPQTKPAETKPAETKPTDTKPADTKPADAKPADTKPADVAPAAPKPPAKDSIETEFDTGPGT